MYQHSLLMGRQCNTSQPVEPPVTAEESPQTKIGETQTGAAQLEHRETMTELRNGSEVVARRLLKAVHVYTSYHSVTRRVLPAGIDFFGKTLLGLTSVAGFAPTLQQSLRSASLYLDVSPCAC
jgi:hypothetical protein